MTTILDQMKAPPKNRDSKLDELIELAGQLITMMPVAELARLSAHEYDQDVVVPPDGSAGGAFLRACAREFVRWIAAEGRFPQDLGSVTDMQVTWHRDQCPPATAAQAFVDLGLYFSHHADGCAGADVEQLCRALDAAAGELVFMLAQEYGPLV